MKGIIWGLCLGLLTSSLWADPVRVRIVAGNLTSGNRQAYSPDNGNHSNPEGAGARIFKGLKPDVALVQEFNTSIPTRQWVNATFGEDFSLFVEREAQIPNGIVSRYPIVESGEWDDVTQDNRDFIWAKIALPNGKYLWAISVHLYSKKSGVRADETKALLAFIKAKIPAEDLITLGGDFNTRTKQEPCLTTFQTMFDGGDDAADQTGNPNTNASRNKPYDWVLADKELAACVTPVKVGMAEYPHALVFDSRVYMPLSDVAPVQEGDSGVTNMQHMAVVRDFLLP